MRQRMRNKLCGEKNKNKIKFIKSIIWRKKHTRFSWHSPVIDYEKSIKKRRFPAVKKNYLFFKPLKTIACAIITEFSRNSFIKKGTINVVIICAIKDAMAAPTLARRGIKRKFKPTFDIAAAKYKYLRYFCLSIQTIHAFLATPK